MTQHCAMPIHMRTVSWHDAPAPEPAPLPGPGEVITWIAKLPLLPTSRERATRTLSDDERERMARFVQAADQERFLAGRGLLRALLGSCLHMPPEAIRFAEGTHGKPLLAPGQGGPLHFNVSHSGAVVAIALAITFDVGVDVEFEGRLREWEPVAQRILSPREKTELESIPHPHRPRAFLNAWTRKEALLKATGDGRIDDIPSIEVSLSPGVPPRIFSLGTIAAPNRDHALRELPLPSGYVGALAACRTR